jgi:molecular chaperone GrpE
MENVRRRSSREVENARKFAVEGLLSDLLPVLDSLEKAVETAQNTAGAEAIAEGVELSLKLFSDSLGRFGVEQIDPLGAPFDPQQHEAMAMVPNADAEPNSVMEVMQRGYTLNGRLVRAAKVIVTKAP